MVRRWSNLGNSFITLGTFSSLSSLAYAAPKHSFSYTTPSLTTKLPASGWVSESFARRSKIWFKKSHKSRPITTFFLNLFRRSFLRSSHTLSSNFFYFISLHQLNMIPSPNILSFFLIPAGGSFTYLSKLDFKVVRLIGSRALLLQFTAFERFTTRKSQLNTSLFNVEFFRFILKSLRFKSTSLNPLHVLLLRDKSLLSPLPVFIANTLFGASGGSLTSDFFILNRSSMRPSGGLEARSASLLPDLCGKVLLAPRIFLLRLQALYMLALRLIIFKLII